MRSPGLYGGSAPARPGRSFVSGKYYAAMMATQDAAVNLTQNAEFAVRFEVGATTTFDRIGIEVTTGGAGGTVRLGIRYDGANGGPGTLLLDAGTVTATGTGFQEITISQVLTPGRWWLVAVGQGSASLQGRFRVLDPFIGQTGTSSANYGSYYQLGVSGALPASFTIGGESSGPKIMLRAA